MPWGVSPHHLLCLRQGLSSPLDAKLAGMCLLGILLSLSVFHLAIGMLGLQTDTTGTLSTRLSPQLRMVFVVVLLFFPFLSLLRTFTVSVKEALSSFFFSF